MARRTVLRSSPGRARRPGSGRARRGLLEFARNAQGEKVNAALLDPAFRRSTGPFTCIGCGETLIPHLGRVRAHHFAHEPGSNCPLTAPETALHLNAKEQLLELCTEAFANRRIVRLLTRCPRCRRKSARDLAELGDAASSEGSLGPLRADVLVTAKGRPTLAIEVLVTHPVGPDKEALFRAAHVLAVEVDAKEDFLAENLGAVEIRCARTFGFPLCANCAVLEEAERNRKGSGEAAEVAELETYRARGLLGASEPLEHRRKGPVASSLSAKERTRISRGFLCPECGGRQLDFGERIAKHPCPEREPRPVAWLGYDGSLVELLWWRKKT